MTDLFKLIFGILASRFKARATLEAENLVLRQQVNVLRRRTPKRPHVNNTDRFLFVWLYRWFPSVLEVVFDCQAGDHHSLAPCSDMAHRDRTGWLRWSDSNSETSSQNIPLKGRSDCPDPAEFWPQRLFAFELRRPGDAARPRARTSAGVLARTLVIELPSLRRQELPRFSADSEMIRRPPIQQHHCSLGTGLFPQRERVLWSRTASLSGLFPSPPRRPRG